MSTFIHKERIAPRPPGEDLPDLGIFHPSGKPFRRPFLSPDVNSITNTIDGAIEAYGPPPNDEVTASLGDTALNGEVRLFSAVFPEAWDAAQARNAQIIGRSALFLAGQETHRPEEKMRSLSERFRLAFNGENDAKDMLVTNAVSDVVEKACKTGSRMTATAQIVDGKIMQYGQSTEERQFNTRTTFSYNFPELDQMNNIEGQNALSLEAAIAEGRFKPGDKMVECSLVPDAAHSALKGTGLFLREVVAIIRVTTLRTSDELTIESYLVCGTDLRKLPAKETIKTIAAEEGVEKSALINRCDISAFAQLFGKLRVPGVGKISPTEILSKPLHISGEAASALDGIDITMMYDEIVAGIIGAPVMMGNTELYQAITKGVPRPLTRADYERHFARTDKLQADLRPIGAQVAQRCAARWQEVVGDDYAAGRLLHHLSEQAVLKYLAAYLVAQDDKHHRPGFTPDFTSLGMATYHHLMDFQEAIRRNDREAAKESFGLAVKDARSTGCPTGLRNLIEKLIGPGDGAESNGESSWHRGKIHKNSKCNSCKQVKSEVGACHICEDCVNHPEKMEAAWREFKTEQVAEELWKELVAKVFDDLTEFLGVAAKEGVGKALTRKMATW